MRKAKSRAVCASISFFELMHASMLNGNFALAANINGDGLDDTLLAVDALVAVDAFVAVDDLFADISSAAGLSAPSDINVGYINFTGFAKGALLSETTGKSMACDNPYDLSEE